MKDRLLQVRVAKPSNSIDDLWYRELPVWLGKSTNCELNERLLERKAHPGDIDWPVEALRRMRAAEYAGTSWPREPVVDQDQRAILEHDVIETTILVANPQ